MPQTGSIQVRVVTSRAQIPLRGATVLITEEVGGGQDKMLSLQIADISGNIKKVVVLTPELLGSTEPGTATPFSSVDILIQHPGYEIILVKGAQIFPGEASSLQIALEPLVDGVDWIQESNVRIITPQNL